jgi:hypothetical protein
LGTVINFDEWFVQNLKRIKVSLAAGEELVGALADTTTYLTRHDQAMRLRNLKSKILDDVKSLLDEESSAKSGFNKGKLLHTPLSFAIGGLAGVLLHHEKPLETGLNAAKSTLGSKLTFGTVLVAIGQGSLPDDVKAISLSALARQFWMAESAMRKTVVAKGYFLITPRVFAAAMDEIEHVVLEGTLSLPVSLNEFRKRTRLVIVSPFPIVKDE